jgi:hypothetical protein
VLEKIGLGMVITTPMKGVEYWKRFDPGGGADFGKRLEVATEAVAKTTAELVGGAPGDWGSKAIQSRRSRLESEARSGGQTTVARSGAYDSSYTQSDAMAGSMALIRTYRVERGDMALRIRSQASKYMDDLIRAKSLKDTDAQRRIYGKLSTLVNDARTVVPTWFNERDYVAMLQDAKSETTRMAGISEQEAKDIVYGTAGLRTPKNKKASKTHLDRGSGSSMNLKP